MVYALIFFCIIILFLLIVILFVLLVKKAVHNLLEIKKQNYRQFIYPKISQYISHADITFQRLLNPGSSWKKNVMIDILDQIAASIKSEEEFRQVQQLCGEIGLTEDLGRDLKSGKWWTATAATKKVQRFKLVELIPFVIENLHSTNYYLWTASARALSQMNQSRTLIQFLLENHTQLKEWSIIRIGDILVQSGEDDVDLLLEHLPSTPPILTKLFIQILGKRKAIKALSALEYYLDSDQKEFVITALQAIVEIQTTSQPERIAQFLTSPEWEIRMWAVRCIQSCRMADQIPTLIKLLSDSSWWVRLRSAETLYSFGPVGVKILQGVAREHSDAFSRDMALKVLQDKGLEVKAN